MRDLHELVKRSAAGELGPVRHIEGQFSGPPSYQTEPGNWRSNQVESPGGSMTARGVHVIDSMVNIAGLVTSVFAISARLEHAIDVDDIAAACGTSRFHLSRLFKAATGSSPYQYLIDVRLEESARLLRRG